MAETGAEQELREAVKGLYRAFAHCKRPEYMSESVYSPQQQSNLQKKPLGDFTLEEMSDYAWHSIYYEGQEESGLKFWLPRQFDVFSFRTTSWLGCPAKFSGAFDIGIIVHRLVEAGWLSWPEAQRQPVARWFAAWWEACLAHELKEVCWSGECEERSPEVCLEQTKAVGLPISDPLARWLRREDWVAVRNLLQFLIEFAATPPEGDHPSDIFYLRDDPEVIAWVLSEAMVAHLTAVRDRLEDEALAGGDAALNEAEPRVTRIENALAYIPGLRIAAGKQSPSAE